MAEWLEFCIQGGYRPAFTSLKNKKNKNEFCEINRDFVFPFTLNKEVSKKKNCEIKELSEKKDGMESGY